MSELAVYNISASSDDAHQFPGGVTLTGANMRVNSDTAWILLRWTNVLAEASAQLHASDIISATLRLYVPGNIDSPDMTFWGEAADDAETAVAVLNNISDRPRTTADARWTGVDIGAGFHNVNVTDIVREIVGRPGWEKGSAIVLVAQGVTGGDVQVRAYDGSDTEAARLTIAYQDGAPSSTAHGSAYSSGAAHGFGTAFATARGVSVSGVRVTGYADAVCTQVRGAAVSGARMVQGVGEAYSSAAGASSSAGYAVGIAHALLGGVTGHAQSGARLRVVSEFFSTAHGAAHSAASVVGAYAAAFATASGAVRAASAVVGAFATAFSSAAGHARSGARVRAERPTRKVKSILGAVGALVPDPLRPVISLFVFDD